MTRAPLSYASSRPAAAVRAATTGRAHLPFRATATVAMVAIAALLTLSAAGLPMPASAQSARGEAPQPALERVRLTAGIHVISAEVAATAATRARGLMYRTGLGPNEGMLFVFERPERHCFWMRNTLIPLSIAFVSDDGRIVNIADMQPQSDDSHCAAEPVRYALEMNQGWFERRGIGPGGRISGPPFGARPAARPAMPRPDARS